MDKALWFVVGIVAIVLAAVMYKTWTLGGDESHYGIVCIHGHQYYRANFTVKAMLGIVLDQDGRPVECQ